MPLSDSDTTNHLSTDTDVEVRIGNRSRIWLFVPHLLILTAYLILMISESPGMDGAARATAGVFWFLPAIAFSGWQFHRCLIRTRYAPPLRAALYLSWLLPSLPLALMSLYGIMLISETGFGVLL